MNSRKFISVLFVVVLVFTLCVPAFASSSGDTNTALFNRQPLTVLEMTTQNYTDGFIAGTYLRNDELVNIYTSADSDGVYCFYVTGRGFFWASEVSADIWIYKADYVSTTVIIREARLAAYNTATNLYYSTADSSTPQYIYDAANLTVPVYSDEGEGLAALREYLGMSTIEPEEVTYNIPAGYAFIAPYYPSNDNYLRLEVHPSADVSGQWWNDLGVTWGILNELPTGSLPFPLPGTVSVTWVGSGRPNVYGVYPEAVFSRQFTNSDRSNGPFVVVANPLYTHIAFTGSTGFGGQNTVTNPDITIDLNIIAGETVYLVPLFSEAIFQNGDINIVENGGAVLIPGTVNADGSISFTYQDEPYTPVIGGDNTVTTGETIFDIVKNIGTNIKNLLTGPINSIKSITTSVASFLSTIPLLWSWLPPEITELFIAAITIVVGVGVVKFFIGG